MGVVEVVVEGVPSCVHHGNPGPEGEGVGGHTLVFVCLVSKILQQRETNTHTHTHTHTHREPLSRCTEVDIMHVRTHVSLPLYLTYALQHSRNIYMLSITYVHEVRIYRVHHWDRLKCPE